MTEAVEIEVTSLLPMVAFLLFGGWPLAATAAPYASETSSFSSSGASSWRWPNSAEAWTRRIAFLALRLAGTTPARLVAGMFASTAVLSMWVSNTAAAMMVPIALAVVNLVAQRRTGRVLEPGQPIAAERADERNFTPCLVLSIAQGASIGGVATLIGSPPNGIAARFIKQTYGVEVTFVDWLAIGLPLTLVFLPLTWLILTRVGFPSRLGPIEGGREYLEQEIR